MPRLLIENSQIWQNDRFLSGHTLVLSGGVIQDVLSAAEVEIGPGDRRLDCAGAYTMPGFVDVHVHGSKGFDVMDATEASLQGLSEFLVRQGVTSFLGTTMSDSTERIGTALRKMQAFAGEPQSPFLGVHLEGPYLNPVYRGSQPEMHLRPPLREEYSPWFETGLIKLITVAPELAGGELLIREALARDITVSIGHSGASYAAAQSYFEAGVSQITHTFNGMAGIHHRQPGILVAAWEDPQIYFQIIADGVHVHPAVIRMLLRLAGRERVLAITDAMRATGLPDGEFALGDVSVVVKNGEARSKAGGLAGSTLTMAQALKNMMRFCGLSLAEALPMFTRVPARSIGMYPQKGSLKLGADADIVIWDEESGPQATLIAGELVYSNGKMVTASVSAVT